MTELLVFSSFFFPVGALALIVLIVAAVSGRGEPDPTGRRPYAAYLFVVSFLALFTLVFAGFATVASLVDLVTRESYSDSVQFDSSADSSESDSGSSVRGTIRDPETGEIIESDSGSSVRGTIRDPETGEIIRYGSSQPDRFSSIDDEQDNADIRSAVQSGLVAVIAGMVLAFHGGRARRLVDEPGFLDTPSRRIYQGYLYSVCFVAMLTAIGALAAAGYAAFRAAAPGIASTGDSESTKEAAGDLFSAAILALIALLVFLYHWRRAEGVLATSPGMPPEGPGHASATGGPLLPASSPPASASPGSARPAQPDPAPRSEPPSETWAPQPPE